MLTNEQMKIIRERHSDGPKADVHDSAIYYSHTDILALLAEVDRLKGDLETARKYCTGDMFAAILLSRG